jgi:hypothetical protein
MSKSADESVVPRKREADSEISSASKRARMSDTTEFYDFESDFTCSDLTEQETRSHAASSIESADKALSSERNQQDRDHKLALVAKKIDSLVGDILNRVECLETILGQLVASLAKRTNSPHSRDTVELDNLRQKLSQREHELDRVNKETQRLKQEVDQYAKALSLAQLEALDETSNFKRQLEETTEKLYEARVKLRDLQAGHVKNEIPQLIIRSMRIVPSEQTQFSFEVAESDFPGVAKAFELVTMAMKSATSRNGQLLTSGDTKLHTFVISQTHLTAPTDEFGVDVGQINKFLKSPNASVADLTVLFKEALKAFDVQDTQPVETADPVTPRNAMTPRKRTGPVKDFVLGEEKTLSHAETSILKGRAMVIHDDELHLWGSALKACGYHGTDNWQVALLIELLDAGRISLTEKTKLIIHKDEEGKHRVYKNWVKSLKDRLVPLKDKYSKMKVRGF